METSGEYNVSPPGPRKTSRVITWLGRVFRFCLAVAIIGGASTLSYLWVTNPPTTQRRPRGPEAVLVETMPIAMSRQQIVIRAMGTVTPATQIQLAARVAGQISEAHPAFVPGGRFAVGQKILQIDPKDYELLVHQQEGNLTRTESDVRLEMGQQSVARHEFELLLGDMIEDDADLLLRQPQLAAKQAAVEIAQATLEKAKLDLERTAIVAPFNSIVHTRNVELGSYLSPGTPLATLLGTDEFWVEVSVPLDELHWIHFPDDSGDTASTARLYNASAWGTDVFREGRVARLLPGLEPKGRMAQVIITVPNPLGDGTDDVPSLLLDSFVRVEIDGAFIEEVFQAPRTALRSGNSVWIMLPDNTLDVREVDIVWGTTDFVLIAQGLHDGERLVVSNLAAPLPGMLLREAGEHEGKTDGQPTEGKGQGPGQGDGRQRSGS